MSEESRSTRRAFLKGGAIVAAPLAAVGAPAAALAASARHDKLARLEDEKAVRDLHGRWLRHIAKGDHDAAASLYASSSCAGALAGIVTLAQDHAGAGEAMEIAADGRKASARYAATVEMQTPIAPDNTLVQMLHAQGEGYVRTSEARTLKADYVKRPDGTWAIAGLGFEPA